MYGSNLTFINNTAAYQAPAIYFDKMVHKRISYIENSWFGGNFAGRFSGTVFMYLVGNPEIH